MKQVFRRIFDFCQVSTLLYSKRNYSLGAGTYNMPTYACTVSYLWRMTLADDRHLGGDDDDDDDSGE